MMDFLINIDEIKDLLRIIIGSQCPECGAYGGAQCTDGPEPRGNYHDARIAFASEMYETLRGKGVL